ncbi:MAG: C40 family peptidase [Oscillospiraceae bacterium]|nr:C40 family peptidase [Oscillospiraceae bacterium]
MKKIITFIILSLALFAAPAFADGFATGYVTCDTLNVRSAPDETSSIVTRVYRGNEVELLYCNGYNWYCVQLPNGTTGFCHAGYISTERPTSNVDSIIATAKSFLGRPYSYGASGPNAFDCSGFTSYVFAAYGISLPRSSAAQSTVGVTVSRSELQPGDLVFFATGSSGKVSHVGIYIGNGDIIHAATGQGKVVINNFSMNYYSSRFLWGKRVL